MEIDIYSNRFKRMHDLINRKATGTPERFARKIGVSKSNLARYMDYMRAKGLHIMYDKDRESYYYDMENEVSYQCGFTIS